MEIFIFNTYNLAPFHYVGVFISGQISPRIEVKLEKYQLISHISQSCHCYVLVNPTALLLLQHFPILHLGFD